MGMVGMAKILIVVRIITIIMEMITINRMIIIIIMIIITIIIFKSSTRMIIVTRTLIMTRTIKMIITIIITMIIIMIIITTITATLITPTIIKTSTITHKLSKSNLLVPTSKTQTTKIDSSRISMLTKPATTIILISMEITLIKIIHSQIVAEKSQSIITTTPTRTTNLTTTKAGIVSLKKIFHPIATTITPIKANNRPTNSHPIKNR